MGRPSTREKLLDCAEDLFAEHGLEGVSLRAINAAAGLSPAALHYHFGTKESLVSALLDRHMPALMERRRRLLDALELAAEPPTARAVLDALIRPQSELLAQHPVEAARYMRLLYRLQADGDLYTLFRHEKYAGGVDRLVPLLERALPHLPRSIVEIRLGLAIGVTLRSLALDAGAARDGLGAHLEALLDFVTGGLEAPCSEASVCEVTDDEPRQDVASLPTKDPT